MLIHQLFEASAVAGPERTAIVCQGQPVTYGELDRRATRWAAWLQHQGVQRGDRVAVCLDNGIAFVLAMLACWRCGAVLVPIGPQAHASRLQAVLADAGAGLLVRQPSVHARVEATLEDTPALRNCLWVDPDGAPCAADAAGAPFTAPPSIDLDLAALIYTSGSTGEPKGVMLSHANMVAAARSVQAYLDLRPDDVLAGVLPLAYSYGLYQLLLAFQVGASVVLERSFAFPVKVLQTLAAQRVSVFAGVPTTFALWLGLREAATFNWPELRLVTNAAAGLSPETIGRLRALLPQARLVPMYGMTECKRISYLPADQLDARPGSVGRGMPNQEHWLVDEAGRRLPWGRTGELVVRGNHVMRGYWNRPDLSAQVLKPGPLPGEQVLHTGDLFRTDDEGWLYFVGRRDDIIKCRGEKVSPRAIEDVLYTLDSVLEAAVAGVPDPLLGEAIVAWVAPRPGRRLTEREVVRHCKDQLDAGMAPQRVVFVDALPKTDSGKVCKRALAAAASPNDTRPERTLR
jgi:long-chain acyl-CoA synthetase